MSLKLKRALLVMMLILVGSTCAVAAGQAQRTRSPHGNLAIACQNCHASDSWKPVRAALDFNHNRQTHFPLTGPHQKVSCAGCHVSPVFRETDSSCSSCHADIHRRQFGTSCQGCHTVQGWRVQIDSIRQHANRFPLVGAHAAPNCESCHRGAASATFTGLSTACVSCHASDYASARTVDHKTAGFGTNCESCHSLTQWQNPRLGSQFDHSRTGFPLVGAHVSAGCTSSHTQGRFAGTSTTCVSCHISSYTATSNPNHVAAGFSQDCKLCHTPTRWQGAAFDHNRTRFPLSGAHAAAQCSNCHVGNQFANTPTGCFSCHSGAFATATNPNHVAAAFPQDCTLCHGTTAWKPAAFDHSRTRFPLMGAHATVLCTACHKQGQFTGTSTACVSCHLDKYTATTNPNHAAAQFPQDCQLCHTTSQWTGATFDHSRTQFPLTGAHTTVQCTNCHVGNQYTGTPTACFSCHSSEFRNVTNPNHVAAGFPTTCATCHTTTTWAGAQLVHKFPIYSGAHAGRWSTCNDCHTNSSNYAVFSCTNCHAHDRSVMDSKHSGRTGYVYDSLACYGCHPTGKH